MKIMWQSCELKITWQSCEVKVTWQKKFEKETQSRLRDMRENLEIYRVINDVIFISQL